MNAFEIKKIADNPQLADMTANWFHLKWKIPLKAYQESMQECLKQTNAIPQWYVVLDNNHIIAGLGVIENDFHNRKDLTPNICAVYVEKSYRGQGIAGNMLNFVCEDMKIFVWFKMMENKRSLEYIFIICKSLYLFFNLIKEVFHFNAAKA